MSLTSVKMSEEVWLTCLTHALSTETEEIMGLLLGDIQQSRNGTTAVIWAALPQPRSDRQKDRVETNPEQLTAASLQAERMTKATNINTRVIGWYHSHPHITVLPSHVDVRTQAMYQLLDSGFIGLIFSCFSEDAQKVGRIQVIAFQSLDGKQNNHILRPLAISVPKGAVIDLDTSSSENALVKYGFHDQDTGDSRLKSSSKGGAKSLEMDGFYNHSNARTGDIYPNNAIVDIDNMDMSESMQEAMHRSNLEMSGAEYNRKEIPLYLMPTQTLLDFESPLGSFADLQRVLYEEEKTAFNQAIIQNTREGKLHPLMYIHHTSTYQASMCKLMEFCLSPAIDALQDRLRENEIQLKMLDEERKVLESEVVRGESSTVSPRSSSMQSHSPRGSGGSFNHREKDVYAPSNIGNSSGSRSRRSS